MSSRVMMHRLGFVYAGLALLSFGSPARGIQENKPPIIANPTFADGTKGWDIRVYGAAAHVEIDKGLSHDRTQSLRISSNEPSDYSLGQELQLRPGRLYRFTGWLRTLDLQQRGARVFGTFQIQKPGGKGVIASATNHGGNTDWMQESICFEAPADGKIRLAIFFAGFGMATGTAWFDALNLEEIDPSLAPLKVANKPIFEGTINRHQYGQFVEYLCDVVPSMWAEKLYDGSFEGLTPYKVQYLRETDFREHPWYPVGATNRADFALDPNDPVSGQVCKRITVSGPSPCTVGIAQDEVAVDPQQPCIFSCFLKQKGVTGPVLVRVQKENQVYAFAELHPSNQWTKFRTRMAFLTKDSHATLSITFPGPGILWLDNASLMPEKTVDGWRPDVVDALRTLKPGIVRFGGSALDDSNLGEFDWRDTIGDPDHRKPFRAWGGLQPTGPGLEEIVRLCQKVGAEPLICVRVSKKGPKDAAEEVEYFNGSKDTPMGQWRVRNGHADPYHIKYWQIGNERAGKDYEDRLPDFCRAMKAVDPTISLLSSYPTSGVLDKAGRWLDFVCPHQYSIGDLVGTEAELITTRELISKHTSRQTIKVAVTEWNTTAGEWGPRRAMLWTLENALACARYHNLLHRHADLVAVANRSNLTNSFCSGIIQTDNHRLYKTPTYYAQWLYANLAGDRPLRIESSIPPQLAPDVSAQLSNSGELLTIFAVNQNSVPVTRPIDLSAFGDGGQSARVWTLRDTKHAGEADVTNSFSEPDRIRPVQSQYRATSAKFDFCFPALSLTIIQWKIK